MPIGYVDLFTSCTLASRFESRHFEYILSTCSANTSTEPSHVLKFFKVHVLKFLLCFHAEEDFCSFACAFMPLQLVVPYYCWLQFLIRNKFFTVLFSSKHLQTHILSYLHSFEIFELFATSVCTISLQPSSYLSVRYQHPSDPTSDPSLSTMLMVPAKMTTHRYTRTYILTLPSHQMSPLVYSRFSRHPPLQLRLSQTHKVPLRFDFYKQSGQLLVMHLQVAFHCLKSYFSFIGLLVRRHPIQPLS